MTPIRVESEGWAGVHAEVLSDSGSRAAGVSGFHASKLDTSKLSDSRTHKSFTTTFSE
jgi:hypothetical protein